jgi:hypothetical protein
MNKIWKYNEDDEGKVQSVIRVYTHNKQVRVSEHKIDHDLDRTPSGGGYEGRNLWSETFLNRDNSHIPKEILIEVQAAISLLEKYEI